VRITDGNEIAALVDFDIERIADDRLVQRIKELRVTPYPVEREWDYGEAGDHYTCWIVLKHSQSEIEVAYCKDGFEEHDPWGFMFGEDASIGMDCQWYPSLESAVRCSGLAKSPNPEGYEVP
jgi:hypothetical protein